MNRFFYFATGSLCTLSVNSSLNLSGYHDLLVTQIVSLAGGVLSTLIIAYLERYQRKRQE